MATINSKKMMQFCCCCSLFDSSYQVCVLPVEGILMFDCSDPSSNIKSSAEFIAAQIEVRYVATEMNFTVGDGLYYGGFFNAPLKNGRNYYIILRAVSQWKTVGAAPVQCSMIMYWLDMETVSDQNIFFFFSPRLQKVPVSCGLK